MKQSLFDRIYADYKERKYSVKQEQALEARRKNAAKARAKVEENRKLRKAKDESNSI